MYSRVYSGEKLAKSDKEKEKGGVYVQMGVWERKSCKSAGVCLLEGVLCVINPASLIPRVLSVWPTEPSAQAPSTPPGHESCLSHTVGVHTHTHPSQESEWVCGWTLNPSIPSCHKRSLKCCHSLYLIQSVGLLIKIFQLVQFSNESACHLYRLITLL